MNQILNLHRTGVPARHSQVVVYLNKLLYCLSLFLFRPFSHHRERRAPVRPDEARGPLLHPLSRPTAMEQGECTEHDDVLVLEQKRRWRMHIILYPHHGADA